MDRRWVLINEANEVIRTVTPINDSAVLFTYERNLDAGQIFFRKKLNTRLRFKGVDYDYFWDIEKRSARRCEEILIRRDWKCQGRWREAWRGRFSVASGTWDLDNCVFEC